MKVVNSITFLALAFCTGVASAEPRSMTCESRLGKTVVRFDLVRPSTRGYEVSVNGKTLAGINHCLISNAVTDYRFQCDGNEGAADTEMWVGPQEGRLVTVEQAPGSQLMEIQYLYFSVDGSMETSMKEMHRVLPGSPSEQDRFSCHLR
jgi:hypothetical protein